MEYSIGEAAKVLNLSASTLRYYDKEGLMPFVERKASGIRVFKNDDIGALKLIECLKNTGMPIKDIKRFIDLTIIGDDSIEERLEIILKQRESVLHQIEELKGHLDMLDHKKWYYETAKEAGTCGIHKKESKNYQI